MRATPWPLWQLQPPRAKRRRHRPRPKCSRLGSCRAPKPKARSICRPASASLSGTASPMSGASGRMLPAVSAAAGGAPMMRAAGSIRPARGSTRCRRVQTGRARRRLRAAAGTAAATCRRETGSITLVQVPVAELVEESQYGPLPKVATDGRRPIDVYARPSRYAVKAERRRPAAHRGADQRLGLPTTHRRGV